MFSLFWGILVCLPVLQAGQTLLEIPENVASPETVLTERVITDEAAVENGVVIDYRYNDTTTDTRRSAPGCPQNEGGYPWLYYSVSGAETDTKCFLSGVQGPCEYDHVFVPNADTNFGFCNCHCFEKNEWDNFQVDDNQQKPDKLCKSFNDGQLRVFVTRLNKCFTVYEQVRIIQTTNQKIIMRGYQYKNILPNHLILFYRVFVQISKNGLPQLP